MTAATVPMGTPYRARRWLRALKRLPLQLVLLAVSLLMLGPVVVMVGTSLKSNKEVLVNPIGLPRNPTLENYATSWVQGNFATLFANSIFLTVVSMAIATLLAALAAYAIARATSRVASWVYVVLAIGIFLPMQLALIPQFRLILTLGLFNSYVGVILVYVASCIPFGVFLMTAFMRQVPAEIVEAAVLDGCGYFTMFRRIFLPLARPAIVTFWILQGVQIWNDYLTPLLLMTDPGRRTLTTGVIAFKQQYLAQWGNIMAGVVIMSLPILVLFVFAQRYFIRGLYAGSVK
ncbi:carbohydrate ABC transporter permease [Galbitalea sp. SE-J8]|uniref:carbohydrate ABC transporter permease n=1 Tax=Galbitalea sp. SE-J8 TaxID=3054952 RepID=UPI00259C9B13|nr:carbohydrate ABC transporter permease [Galbitalea sp. SE-J8]MDM4762046.1 carbohydrate ABC transporter permease [Galbitalea sp. SE-J8]